MWGSTARRLRSKAREVFLVLGTGSSWFKLKGSGMRFFLQMDSSFSAYKRFLPYSCTAGCR